MLGWRCIAVGMALPKSVKRWSLRTLREKLIKIAAKVVKVRRKTAEMLDFRGISVSCGFSGSLIGHVGDQTH